MYIGTKKVFEPELNPKYSPSGPKKGKKGKKGEKGPKSAKIENNRKGFTY